MAQAGGGHGRSRRAAARGLDRQGRHRDSVTGRGRAHAHRGPGRRRDRGGRRACGDRRLGRGRRRHRRFRAGGGSCRRTRTHPNPRPNPNRSPSGRPPRAAAVAAGHLCDYARTRGVRDRRHRDPVAEVGGRRGRGGRAAARSLDRQGRHGDSVPGCRHAARDQRRGRRRRAGRRPAGPDRLRRAGRRRPSRSRSPSRRPSPHQDRAPKAGTKAEPRRRGTQSRGTQAEPIRPPRVRRTQRRAAPRTSLPWFASSPPTAASTSRPSGLRRRRSHPQAGRPRRGRTPRPRPPPQPRPPPSARRPGEAAPRRHRSRTCAARRRRSTGSGRSPR